MSGIVTCYNLIKSVKEVNAIIGNRVWFYIRMECTDDFFSVQLFEKCTKVRNKFIKKCVDLFA